MDELLKALYDNHYNPLPLSELKREVEDCHKKLIEVLDKPERKLVLQIIDAKDQIAETTSIDCFIAGFQLACKLSYELNHREKTHSLLMKRPIINSNAFLLSNENEGGSQ